MRFLRESLLSFFVMGIVLSLYFVAAGVAVFTVFFHHLMIRPNGLTGIAMGWRGNTIIWQRY
jgi:hypothetical protein